MARQPHLIFQPVDKGANPGLGRNILMDSQPESARDALVAAHAVQASISGSQKTGQHTNAAARRDHPALRDD